MTPALVSILLPTFNGANHLRYAIESVLDQSYKHFELIICDDCSIDETASIAEEFAAQDARIKLFRNQHRVGLFENYNACLSRAVGEFIKPFAQDDLLHPQMVARCIDILTAKSQLSLVAVKRGFIDTSGQMHTIFLPSFENVFPGDEPIAAQEVIEKCLFSVTNYIGEPCTVMFRKRDAHLGFDSSFYHLGDLEYWIRLLLEGDFFFISDTLAYFRAHDSSTSAENTKALKVAPDIISLAHKYEWLLQARGKDRKSFIANSLTDLGAYIDLLIREDHLTEADFLVPQLPTESREAADVRKLAYYAVSALLEQNQVVARSLNEVAKIRKNQQMIDVLEGEVRTMLESNSWRMTKPLRDANRLLSLSGGDLQLELQTTESAGDVISEQLEYIQYLSRLKDRILRSRSWQLTKPLRAQDTLLPNRN